LIVIQNLNLNIEKQKIKPNLLNFYQFSPISLENRVHFSTALFERIIKSKVLKKSLRMNVVPTKENLMSEES